MIATVFKKTDVVAATAAERRVPWRGLLFIFAIFYLATPLSPTFSMNDVGNLPKIQMSDAERAELNAEHTEQGSLGRRLALLALGGFGIWALMQQSSSRQVRVQGALAWSIVFFLAWCALTVVWSVDVGMTLRKLLVLACLCLGAVGTAKLFSLRQIVQMTFYISSLLLFVGIASEIAVHSFTPWAADYRYSGLTWPAFSAWMLSLQVLAFPSLRSDKASETRGWFMVASTVLAVVALVFTKTRAAFAALAVAALVYVAMTWTGRQKMVACLAAGVVIATTLLVGELTVGEAFTHKVFATANLGREESLEGISGRANLWAELMTFIGRRPLLGYGFDSFWTPAHLLEIGESNWGAPDAHNGYINLALGVGLIGTAAYVVALLLGTIGSLLRFRRTQDRGDLFTCCALIILSINASFVSTQLAPALYSFLTMVFLARLAFVEETIVQVAPTPLPILRAAWRSPEIKLFAPEIS